MRDIKARHSPLPIALLLLGLAGVALCGCGTNTELTKQERDNMKGGPMPPGYMEEAAQRKAAAEKNV
ncbi:MAG TPA: hypothetical protein VKU00_13330, partial [Chthonomonadaceae bacterium]|nr:hypothetical protein [Chthonomonadaceae bacterium]